MKMKMLLSILFALGVLWVVDKAEAAPQNSLCNNTYECFAINNDRIVPAEQIKNYPTYAWNDDSSFGRTYNSGGERAFVFSPRTKQWAAYDNDGYKVASGIANGGSDMCADLGHPCHTPSGTFHVQRKGSADCVSKQFPIGVGGAQMPYCMFFTGGYAIHGSPYISNRNGSHGCIRIHTHAAKWLSRYFVNHGTKVVVLPY
jgi:lipoprotein-anchoring transpeptidase ErfK/SrfK